MLYNINLSSLLLGCLMKQPSLLTLPQFPLSKQDFEPELFHKIIYVAAPETIRIKRIEARDGLDEKSIQQRMDKQWPDEKKIALSDYIIHNDELQLLIPQVLSISEKLQRI